MSRITSVFVLFKSIYCLLESQMVIYNSGSYLFSSFIWDRNVLKCPLIFLPQILRQTICWLSLRHTILSININLCAIRTLQYWCFTQMRDLCFCWCLINIINILYREIICGHLIAGLLEIWRVFGSSISGSKFVRTGHSWISYIKWALAWLYQLPQQDLKGFCRFSF